MAEVDFDAAVIDQHVVHFEVGLLARLITAQSIHMAEDEPGIHTASMSHAVGPEVGQVFLKFACFCHCVM